MRRHFKKCFNKEGVRRPHFFLLFFFLSSPEGLRSCPARVQVIPDRTSEPCTAVFCFYPGSSRHLTTSPKCMEFYFTSFQWIANYTALNKSHGSASALPASDSSSSCSVGIIYECSFGRSSHSAGQTLCLVCCGQTSRASCTSCGFWRESWGHNVLAKANAPIYFWNYPFGTVERWGVCFLFSFRTKDRK